jgi:hypothetical protein
MARPRTAAADYQVVSVRFPKDIMDRCRQTAEQEDRSLNEQLLHIVKRWVADKIHNDAPTPPTRPGVAPVA